MKVAINRESHVPIRDQLIEQVALQIASGSLRGEEKLPSVRALAQRLGIHYNTVGSAYTYLAEAGLLEIRQGSGVRVASKMRRRELDVRASSVEDLLRDFLGVAAEQGYSRKDMEQCLRRVLSTNPVKSILLVDRNPDFHRLIEAELAPEFDLPVRAVTVDDLAALTDPCAEALLVTSLYHLPAIKGMPLDPTRLVVANVEPGRAEQEAVAALPRGSLLLLVSVSPTLLRMATNVMSALRGDSVAIRAVELSDRKELAYASRFANLIVCDAPSREAVAGLCQHTPVKVFRLYSPSTIELIRERLRKWG